MVLLTALHTLYKCVSVHSYAWRNVGQFLRFQRVHLNRSSNAFHGDLVGESDARKVASLSRMDTLILMSVKISSMDNIPKSLVVPSCNLKLNESVGQGKYYVLH